MITLPLWVRWALIGLAAALVYFQGRSDGRNQAAAKALAQVARIAAAADAARNRIDRVGAQFAQLRATQSSDFREIRNETIRIIERPAYRAVCVDPDGVGLLDRAAAAANREPAGASPDATAEAAESAP